MTARVVVVSGTDTEVGKTVTTAAIAAQVTARGESVVIYKPAQTGVPPSNATEVLRPVWPVDADQGDAVWAAAIAGCHCAPDGVRLADPLSPVMAARRARLPLPSIDDHLATIETLAAQFDRVLVEGAGGILVGIGPDDATVVDLIEAVPAAAVVVVTRPALGTLNHTWLTTRELDRLTRPAGIVIGSWPAAEAPTWERTVAVENSAELTRLTGWPVLGRLPSGAGRLSPEQFREAVRLDLTPLGIG